MATAMLNKGTAAFDVADGPARQPRSGPVRRCRRWLSQLECGVGSVDRHLSRLTSRARSTSTSSGVRLSMETCPRCFCG
jgi:hypothetical protein